MKHVVFACSEFYDILQSKLELFADEFIALFHAFGILLGILVLLLGGRGIEPIVFDRRVELLLLAEQVEFVSVECVFSFAYVGACLQIVEDGDGHGEANGVGQVFLYLSEEGGIGA